MAALGRSGPIVALAIVLLLGACGGNALRWEPRVHIVRSGETLQAIAFRYRLDERDLAAWNAIDNPDVIFAGQRLHLAPPAGYRARTPAPRATVRRGTSAPGKPAQVENLESLQWQWPANGQIVARFDSGSSLGRGLDLVGNQGDPIRASAPGKVVYSGSGLLGYGKLIILKHNATYLSAYGHNDTLLVGEGDEVKAGQRIATMGLGPGDKPVLHFEIRQEGKPVDPLRYLPAR